MGGTAAEAARAPRVWTRTCLTPEEPDAKANVTIAANKQADINSGPSRAQRFDDSGFRDIKSIRFPYP